MLDSFLHKTLRIPYRLNITKMRKSQNPKAVVIFIHGIASGAGMWQKAESEIEGELDIYAVDLIGHGESPKPKWPGAQQLGVQARAIRRMTFLMKKYKKPLFLVGHSMGSLVAAEFSKKYSNVVDGIFLLSPPIYSPEEAHGTIQESILKKGYEKIVKKPEKSIKFVNAVIDTGAVDVDKFGSQEQFRPIRRALKEAIIEQDTFVVLSKTKTPTKIIYGVFDPVVIGRNIRKLGRINKNITTSRVLSSHDPTKSMIEQVSKGIDKILKEKYE
jgi:alpha/beta hydrolase family protein